MKLGTLVAGATLAVSVVCVGAAVTAPADAAPSAPTSPGCDPIGAGACLLPFPDDFYTVRDHSTATGLRVNFTAAEMPANVAGIHIDPAEYDRNDGFSPGAALLAEIPGVSLTASGAAPVTDIGASLRPDAPIVIVDTRTGQRVPYWAELDSRATDPARQALIVHPAVQLTDGHHYAVALRNLRDASGNLIAPSATFAAVSGMRPPRDLTLRSRWQQLHPVLETLRRHGVSTHNLNLAWDFTVASEENLTDRAVHMRDTAFAQLGNKAPAVTITQVTDYTPAQDAQIARQVRGVVAVPSFLNAPGGPTGSTLHYPVANPGPNTLPTQIPGNVQQAAFVCNIPRVAFTDPARPALYGHGLLGSPTEINAANVKAMSAENDITFCATPWLGLAAEDTNTVAAAIANFALFQTVPDRMQQAYLDFLFLGRALIHPDGLRTLSAFRAPDGRPLISGDKPLVYDGNSQGGIEGGALTALAQDFRLAALGVPGMNYSLLLNRSVDYIPFQNIMDVAYPDRLSQQVIFQVIQMIWDRGDADGYAQHMTTDPLPGTPTHRVLMHEAFGDHQVANVATEVEARTIGARIHQPALAPGRSPDVVPYWGIQPIPFYPYPGSALVVWDSGTPPPPTGNLPPVGPQYGNDPHSDPRNTPAARVQKGLFFDTGLVFDVCGGAPCRAVPSS